MEKNNSLIIILLVLVICCLGGYIAYDKIGNNRDNKQDLKEPQKVNIANLYKSVDLDYAINGKIVKVGFNYTIEKVKVDDRNESVLYTTLSFDGKVNEKMKYKVDSYESDDEAKKSAFIDEIGRKNISIIKGNDKEYFVFYLEAFLSGAGPNRDLMILNDDGTVIYNVPIEKQGNSFDVNDSHYNYEVFYTTYDALYYIDNTCNSLKTKYEINNPEDEVIYLLDEYKVTVENGKVNAKKTKTLEGTDGRGMLC